MLNEIKTTWPPPKHKILYFALSQLLVGIFTLFKVLIRTLGQGAHIGSNSDVIWSTFLFYCIHNGCYLDNDLTFCGLKVITMSNECETDYILQPASYLCDVPVFNTSNSWWIECPSDMNVQSICAYNLTLCQMHLSRSGCGTIFDANIKFKISTWRPFKNVHYSQDNVHYSMNICNSHDRPVGSALRW